MLHLSLCVGVCVCQVYKNSLNFTLPCSWNYNTFSLKTVTLNFGPFANNNVSLLTIHYHYYRFHASSPTIISTYVFDDNDEGDDDSSTTFNSIIIVV